jgi:hypothetical protein
MSAVRSRPPTRTTISRARLEAGLEAGLEAARHEASLQAHYNINIYHYHSHKY